MCSTALLRPGKMHVSMHVLQTQAQSRFVGTVLPRNVSSAEHHSTDSVWEDTLSATVQMGHGDYSKGLARRPKRGAVHSSRAGLASDSVIWDAAQVKCRNREQVG